MPGGGLQRATGIRVVLAWTLALSLMAGDVAAIGMAQVQWPFAAADICHAGGTPAPLPAAVPDCCILCLVPAVLAPVAPLLPRPHLAGLPVARRPIAMAPRAIRRRRHRRARAPPVIGPR